MAVDLYSLRPETAVDDDDLKRLLAEKTYLEAIIDKQNICLEKQRLYEQELEEKLLVHAKRQQNAAKYVRSVVQLRDRFIQFKADAQVQTCSADLEAPQLNASTSTDNLGVSEPSPIQQLERDFDGSRAIRTPSAHQTAQPAVNHGQISTKQAGSDDDEVQFLQVANPAQSWQSTANRPSTTATLPNPRQPWNHLGLESAQDMRTTQPLQQQRQPFVVPDVQQLRLPQLPAEPLDSHQRPELGALQMRPMAPNTSQQQQMLMALSSNLYLQLQQHAQAQQQPLRVQPQQMNQVPQQLHHQGQQMNPAPQQMPQLQQQYSRQTQHHLQEQQMNPPSLLQQYHQQQLLPSPLIRQQPIDAGGFQQRPQEQICRPQFSHLFDHDPSERIFNFVLGCPVCAAIGSPDLTLSGRRNLTFYTDAKLEESIAEAFQLDCGPPYDEHLLCRPHTRIGIDIEMLEHQVNETLNQKGHPLLPFMAKSKATAQIKKLDLFARKCRGWEQTYKQKLPYKLPPAVVNVIKWYVLLKATDLKESVLDHKQLDKLCRNLHVLHHVIHARKLGPQSLQTHVVNPLV